MINEAPALNKSSAELSPVTTCELLNHTTPLSRLAHDVTEVAA